MIKALVRLTVFLAVISICVMVSAHIGDTKQECIDRYGKPVNQVNDITVFESGEFYVMITFFDGEADSIGYMKKDNKAISKSEITSLREANGKERLWIEGPDGRSWGTLDLYLLAYYFTDKNMLIIGTKAHIDREKEK